MLQGIRWLPAAVRMEFFPLCFAQLTRCIRESTQAVLGGAGGWRPWQKTSLGEIIWEMVWCTMNNPIIIWLYHFCFILRFRIAYPYVSVSHTMRLGVYCNLEPWTPTLANRVLSEWLRKALSPRTLSLFFICGVTILISIAWDSGG